jgi:hypothetical protein
LEQLNLFPSERQSEFEPEVKNDEGSSGKLCRNTKEDAGWTGLRIAANIPTNQADNRFELPLRQGFVEVVRQGLRKEIVGGASSSNSTQEVRAFQEEDVQADVSEALASTEK